VGVPRGVMGIGVTENKGIMGVQEKFKGEGARLRIELSASDGRGVDIEKEKRRSLLEVDFDAEIV